MHSTLAHDKSRWITRNEILHSKDWKNLANAVTKDALLARIGALYTHEENVLVQDRFPFATPIEEWPDKTTPQMKQWLRSNQPHIKICLTLAKEQNKLHTKDIRSYIQGTTKTLPKRTKTVKRKKKPKNNTERHKQETHRKAHPTEEKRQSTLTANMFTTNKLKPRSPRHVGALGNICLLARVACC